MIILLKKVIKKIFIYFLENNLNIQSKTIFEKKVELDEIKNEIKTIKLVIEKIKLKNSTRMDQIITSNELSKILKDFTIAFPIEKINQILIYLELNPLSFNISDFCQNLKTCKILGREICTDEIITIILKLKDIIYTLGGEQFFFGNTPRETDTLSKMKFINLLKSREVNVNYSEEILEEVFIYLTKTEKDLTIQEFRKHFQETKFNELDDDFEIKATNIINQRISKLSYNANEYFDYLLSKKNYRNDNNLTRIDFQKTLINDGFKFTAEEIDFIFRKIDSGKDGFVSRDKFILFVTRVHDGLYKIKDVIKKEKLEIEDILYKMVLDKKKPLQRFDLLNFKISKYYFIM